MVEAEGRRGGTTLTARVSHIIAGRRARRFRSAQVALSLLVFLAGLKFASKQSRSVELAFLPARNGKAVVPLDGAGGRERCIAALPPATGSGTDGSWTQSRRGACGGSAE